jgi:hypothetical protein
MIDDLPPAGKVRVTISNVLTTTTSYYDRKVRGANEYSFSAAAFRRSSFLMTVGCWLLIALRVAGTVSCEQATLVSWAPRAISYAFVLRDCWTTLTMAPVCARVPQSGRADLSDRQGGLQPLAIAASTQSSTSPLSASTSPSSQATRSEPAGTAVDLEHIPV